MQNDQLTSKYKNYLDDYKSDLIEYGYIAHCGFLSEEEENALVNRWEKEADDRKDKNLQEAITEYKENKKLLIDILLRNPYV